tara:strand:+ start:54 stop:461 length:408 start_codon:yes stop_codon:yes gene_type:complete
MRGRQKIPATYYHPRTTPEKRQATLDKYNNTTERKKYMKEYYKKNKMRAKARSMENRYGITIEQYWQMLKDQNFACKVCNSHMTDHKKGLCVDHDHTTGKVRALLCKGCNVALGEIKENKDTLAKLIMYLEEHNG